MRRELRAVEAMAKRTGDAIQRSMEGGGHSGGGRGPMRESFRHTRDFGAFRPSVAVTVQGYAGNPKLAATRGKNSVARSPARTRDKYGNNGPSAGRSLNKFNASLPKWTSTGTPVFFRLQLTVPLVQSTSLPFKLAMSP